MEFKASWFLFKRFVDWKNEPHLLKCGAALSLFRSHWLHSNMIYRCFLSISQQIISFVTALIHLHLVTVKRVNGRRNVDAAQQSYEQRRRSTLTLLSAFCSKCKYSNRSRSLTSLSCTDKDTNTEQLIESSDQIHVCTGCLESSKLCFNSVNTKTCTSKFSPVSSLRTSVFVSDWRTPTPHYMKH